MKVANIHAIVIRTYSTAHSFCTAIAMCSGRMHMIFDKESEFAAINFKWRVSYHEKVLLVVNLKCNKILNLKCNKILNLRMDNRKNNCND